MSSIPCIFYGKRIEAKTVEGSESWSEEMYIQI